ncbi:MAG TPA: aminotransferase class I/II-fold pyridoxal phosphate-dependent enzyme [Solirubrobacteraceae bacterium]|nr:aminotransferase class I/II-fold pyridoxal phosphate-dependent enzyme [Solirubrobacteraceae bacterium]
MDAEAMRALGYRTVDMLVARLTDPTIPPLRRASPAEMRARLSGPPPQDGQDFEAIIERLERDVLPFMSRGDHPGFFAFIPFSGTWPGALGDFVASACNVYAGSWMESAGPTQLELEVLSWFQEWIGYPAGAGGILVGGGSAANLTALACARESLVGAMTGDVVGYVSDQGHSSLGRAARVLGFRPEQVRVLPHDADFRLDARAVGAAMDADLRAGRRPLFVAATAGTTNTGSIDPLEELADLCRERGVWLHVDAAYGGFAALTERGRALLRGIELADSVTLDPHKWLYQPYECGALLVRDDQTLRAAFQMTPDYLQDAEEAAGEVNLSDRGVQLTRSSRAFKVWLSLQYFGARAFTEAIDRSLDLAELVHHRVLAGDDLELMAPPSLGVVCFRRRFEGLVADDDEADRRNAALVAGLERSGLGLVSSTVLRGRYALRVCVMNHTTTRADVERVMDFFETCEPAALSAEAAAVTYRRDRDMRHAPLRRRGPAGEAAGVTADALAGLPLFAGLDDEGRARVASLAQLEARAPGETIVEQWDAALDFYVIVEGDVEVLIDEAAVNRLSEGEFFGELAALDWGGGFGYPRIASVRALTDVTLLTFPAGALNELARDWPHIAGEIRRVGAARLHGRGAPP